MLCDLSFFKTLMLTFLQIDILDSNVHRFSIREAHFNNFNNFNCSCSSSLLVIFILFFLCCFKSLMLLRLLIESGMIRLRTVKRKDGFDTFRSRASIL